MRRRQVDDKYIYIYIYRNFSAVVTTGIGSLPLANKYTFVYIFGGCMRFPLSSRASVASRCFPPRPVLHMASRQACFYLRRQDAASCELYLVSAAWCSPLVVPLFLNVDEVFCQRDLSLVHKFPRKVFRCTKNGVWNFAGLHPSRTTEQPNKPSFEHAELVLCCFYKISHLCAYLKSRKTLRYGGVQRARIIYHLVRTSSNCACVSITRFFLYDNIII